MIKFSKIQAFKNAVKHVRRNPEAYPTSIVFERTLKLHGTNAGILVEPSGHYVPQSRNRALTIDRDNLGFAAWAFRSEVERRIRALAHDIGVANGLNAEPVVVYGEWVGPGIQRGVAVSQLPEKQFVVFGAGVPCHDAEGNKSRRYIPIHRSLDHVNPEIGLRSIYEVGYEVEEVDLHDREQTAEFAERANAMIESIEEQCPWGARFGVEGPGEGYVYKPVGDHFGDSDLFFKVKGEKHQAGGGKKATTVSVDHLAVDKFVGMALTEARLNQGIEYLREMGKPIEMRSTGDFIKWVSKDVAEEMKEEVVESGLEWKHISKSLGAEAVRWWKHYVETEA